MDWKKLLGRAMILASCFLSTSCGGGGGGATATTTTSVEATSTTTVIDTTTSGASTTSTSAAVGTTTTIGSTTSTTLLSGELLSPGDLIYLGAFRLPERAPGAPDAQGWEWSGEGLAYNPDGDPSDSGDGYPGSLFAAGLQSDNYVAEISIPAPVVSKNLDDLNVAGTLQGLTDIRSGYFEAFDEIPRMGMEVLPQQAGQSSAKLYLSWGQHFQDNATTMIPSHAWCDLDLSKPNTMGSWWVGDADMLYSVNAYMFAIPSDWAAAHVGGRMLGTGRFRDGGWSGKGPSLYAIGPWLDGAPPSAGASLSYVPLLQYSNTRGDDTTDYTLTDYKHSDEWEGGAWLSSGSKSAVVFVGTKGSGYTWYGFFSPAGDGVPCVADYITDMVNCYNPDGTVCSAELRGYCDGHSPESRGWWNSRFDAQMIFYNPDDLAAVAAGTMQPYEPQPYAILDIDEHLILGPTDDPILHGSGDQRRYRLGEPAYDRARGFLYVLERQADGSKPVIHVWSVN
ncbi:MAG: hypothetical protein KJ950_04605 [Proteobacteria bacterium]|nr:hypothetical protein [Pseudomonadota bacterium]MBU1688548.1 hypothetical protein [Pseudomonadota bacterium]